MLPTGQLVELGGSGRGIPSMRKGGGGSGGLPQENISFENALRLGFGLSGFHI